ncbi:MAG: heavy metal sensor histidine kinase [Burkholderiaceae bacterium]
MTRRPSIRRRMAAGMALLGLCLFGVIGAFEYLAFERELQRTRVQAMDGALAVVRHLLDETRDEPDLATLSHRLSDMLLGHVDTRVWLIGRDGRQLYGQGPAPTGGFEPGHGLVETLAPEQRADVGRIVMTIDDEEGRRLRASLARILVLCLVAGTGVAIALGLVLSERALRPLARISRQANALSATSIGDRLPEQGVDAELMDLVASFNRALARIETAFRQQQAFSADVAHELNTPLTTLITGAEIALASSADDASLREFLASGLDDLHRLKGIVRDMLFLARADQGATVDRFPSSSLADVVRDVVDYHEAALDDARLRARIDGDADAPVDAMLIKRAVSNLLSNATRFAVPGSSVVIRIASDGASRSVAVANEGPPLPDALVKRMFDRFHRGEQSRAQSDQHHGLGLAIVSAIARMHGGETFAHSVGGVTTVGFTVSDRDARRDKRPAGSAASGSSTTGCRR